MTRREPHTTYVALLEGDEYQAKCSDCNWRGGVRQTFAAAEKDLPRHA